VSLSESEKERYERLTEEMKMVLAYLAHKGLLDDFKKFREKILKLPLPKEKKN